MRKVQIRSPFLRRQRTLHEWPDLKAWVSRGAGVDERRRHRRERPDRVRIREVAEAAVRIGQRRVDAGRWTALELHLQGVVPRCGEIGQHADLGSARVRPRRLRETRPEVEVDDPRQIPPKGADVSGEHSRAPAEVLIDTYARPVEERVLDRRIEGEHARGIGIEFRQPSVQQERHVAGRA